MSGDRGHAPARGRDRHRSVALRVLAVVLMIEAAALAALTVFLLVEVLTVRPDSYASAIGVTVMAAIGTAWLALAAIGTLRSQPWVRGSVITLQLIQIAIAVGCFQGIVGRPDVGWVLIVPAVVALVLLFTSPVRAATSRDAG